MKRQCGLCKFEKPSTRHHLTTKADVQSEIVRLCPECHRVVHRLFTRDELRQHYNTVESLQNNARIREYLNETESECHAGGYKWRKVCPAEEEWINWMIFCARHVPNIWMMIREPWSR